MFESSFSCEATNVLQYIKDWLLKKYPTNRVTTDYFLLSVLENEESVAYQILSKSTLSSTLNNMRDWLVQTLDKAKIQNESDHVDYDIVYVNAANFAIKEYNASPITSGHLLLALIRLTEQIERQFKQIGITYEQLFANLNAMLPKVQNNGEGIMKNNIVHQQPLIKGPAEDMLINMNNLALNGKIDEVIGNDDVINRIFNILSKRDRNNVVVVGESGVGKTATVSHIANLLVNGNVPDVFKNKKLLKMDFMQLVSGSALRGNFESKFNLIIADAIKKNGYIFFVDDLQSILSESSKFGEVNTVNMLDMILMERNIKFICTMDNSSYSTYILGNPSLKRRFQKVEIKEKGRDEIIEILNKCKTKYEKYHNVAYSEKAIETCVDLSIKYAKDSKLPDYAIDILDEVGAVKSLMQNEDPRIAKCKKELKTIESKIKALSNGNGEQQYPVAYDKLKAEEIQVNSNLQILEKELLLDNGSLNITDDDIRDIISKKTNIPVTTLNENERDNLKKLNDVLKSFVIGQDEAINEVCRVVKRQRIGMSNSNRPAVLFFTGTTGSGKTYLSKKLAEVVFGNEKSMVRLDMSEYSDKTSVTKLYGSSAGYIGYDKGGILTESIKKNNHCVLLLDEIEKANDEVHNVFLQLFDDGRLTDNRGNIVDFSNVIVIMTSNIGAKEVSKSGGGIGFVKDENTNNREIITKALKNKFTPEFINRIDSIVFFNKLTEDNIKQIIRLEIGKVEKKVCDMGYQLGETFKSDECISFIYSKVKDEADYGARPVIHIIQHDIEDRITDYIIDKQPSDGAIIETKMIGLAF